MHFTSKHQHSNGLLEREFTLGDVPGVLWTPPAGAAPAPLILIGHPGGLRNLYPRLAGRAQHCATNGFAAATIELPGCGDRPRSVTADRTRADLRSAIAAGEPVDDDIIDRLILPLVDAFGSQEKALNANLGGHTGVPAYAGEDAYRFFVRHLG